MRSSQETTASPAGQNSQEPQEAPTEENPYYARTYKKVSEPEKEKLKRTAKKIRQKSKKKKDILLISLLLRSLLRNKPRKRNHRELQESWDLPQPAPQSSAWWQALYSRA